MEGLTKDQAIEAMKLGEKITHRYFDSKEWMTMQDGKILLEDGVKCYPHEFWHWRQSQDWNDGYSLYDAPKPN